MLRILLKLIIIFSKKFLTDTLNNCIINITNKDTTYTEGNNMNKTELIKSIENGNLEFVSPSEGIQYTISNDCDGWKADGAEISTGLDGGFYTAETLEELAGYLQQIGDLQVA